MVERDDGAKRRLVELIKINAYNLYSACICIGPSKLRDWFEFLKDPKAGDLVMEITTHRMKGRDPMEGIGRLVKVAQEPTSTREEWIEAGGTEDEKIPTHRVFYLKLEFDDGREFRWTNASFIKVPEDFLPEW